MRRLINMLRGRPPSSLPVAQPPVTEPSPPPPTKLEFLKSVRQRYIDPDVISPTYQAFLDFVDTLQGESDYGDDHYLRYCASVRLLTELHHDLQDLLICEPGGGSHVSRFIHAQGGRVVGTEHDLRYPSDMPGGQFDVVLSLEVIEHINDQDTADLHQSAIFRETGVRTYVAEMQRICKPGGHILLTTPNPNSLTSLQNLISGAAPGVFRPHVREYTRDELTGLFAGCDVITYRTHSCFTNIDVTDDSVIAQFEALGASSRYRGDDHYFVFRTPQ